MSLIFKFLFIHHDKSIILAETDDNASEYDMSDNCISCWDHICFTERISIEYIILLFRYVLLAMSRWQDLSISDCIYQSSMINCDREECKNNSWETQQSSTRQSQRMIQ